MNKLSTDRQAQIIGALVEGNSIRSTERMTGVHRDTIMRLMVRVGQGCEILLDEEMRVTPAMAAGITPKFWSLADLVDRQSN